MKGRDGSAITVSVVVPTSNRLQWLGQCLESLLSQRGPAFD